MDAKDTALGKYHITTPELIPPCLCSHCRRPSDDTSFTYTQLYKISKDLHSTFSSFEYKYKLFSGDVSMARSPQKHAMCDCAPCTTTGGYRFNLNQVTFKTHSMSRGDRLLSNVKEISTNSKNMVPPHPLQSTHAREMDQIAPQKSSIQSYDSSHQDTSGSRPRTSKDFSHRYASTSTPKAMMKTNASQRMSSEVNTCRASSSNDYNIDHDQQYPHQPSNRILMVHGLAFSSETFFPLIKELQHILGSHHRKHTQITSGFHDTGSTLPSSPSISSSSSSTSASSIFPITSAASTSSTLSSSISNSSLTSSSLLHLRQRHIASTSSTATGVSAGAGTGSSITTSTTTSSKQFVTTLKFRDSFQYEGGRSNAPSDDDHGLLSSPPPAHNPTNHQTPTTGTIGGGQSSRLKQPQQQQHPHSQVQTHGPSDHGYRPIELSSSSSSISSPPSSPNKLRLTFRNNESITPAGTSQLDPTPNSNTRGLQLRPSRLGTAGYHDPAQHSGTNQEDDIDDIIIQDMISVQSPSSTTKKVLPSVDGGRLSSKQQHHEKQRRTAKLPIDGVPSYDVIIPDLRGHGRFFTPMHGMQFPKPSNMTHFSENSSSSGAGDHGHHGSGSGNQILPPLSSHMDTYPTNDDDTPFDANTLANTQFYGLSIHVLLLDLLSVLAHLDCPSSTPMDISSHPSPPPNEYDSLSEESSYHSSQAKDDSIATTTNLHDENTYSGGISVNVNGYSHSHHDRDSNTTNDHIDTQTVISYNPSDTEPSPLMDDHSHIKTTTNPVSPTNHNEQVSSHLNSNHGSSSSVGHRLQPAATENGMHRILTDDRSQIDADDAHLLSIQRTDLTLIGHSLGGVLVTHLSTLLTTIHYLFFILRTMQWINSDSGSASQQSSTPLPARMFLKSLQDTEITIDEEMIATIAHHESVYYTVLMLLIQQHNICVQVHRRQSSSDHHINGDDTQVECLSPSTSISSTSIHTTEHMVGLPTPNHQHQQDHLQSQSQHQSSCVSILYLLFTHQYQVKCVIPICSSQEPATALARSIAVNTSIAPLDSTTIQQQHHHHHHHHHLNQHPIGADTTMDFVRNECPPSESQFQPVEDLTIYDTVMPRDIIPSTQSIISSTVSRSTHEESVNNPYIHPAHSYHTKLTSSTHQNDFMMVAQHPHQRLLDDNPSTQGSPISPHGHMQSHTLFGDKSAISYMDASSTSPTAAQMHPPHTSMNSHRNSLSTHKVTHTHSQYSQQNIYRKLSHTGSASTSTSVVTSLSTHQTRSTGPASRILSHGALAAGQMNTAPGLVLNRDEASHSGHSSGPSPTNQTNSQSSTTTPHSSEYVNTARSSPFSSMTLSAQQDSKSTEHDERTTSTTLSNTVFSPRTDYVQSQQQSGAKQNHLQLQQQPSKGMLQGKKIAPASPSTPMSLQLHSPRLGYLQTRTSPHPSPPPSASPPLPEEDSQDGVDDSSSTLHEVVPIHPIPIAPKVQTSSTYTTNTPHRRSSAMMRSPMSTSSSHSSSDRSPTIPPKIYDYPPRILPNYFSHISEGEDDDGGDDDRLNRLATYQLADQPSSVSPDDEHSQTPSQPTSSSESPSPPIPTQLSRTKSSDSKGLDHRAMMTTSSASYPSSHSQLSMASVASVTPSQRMEGILHFFHSQSPARDTTSSGSVSIVRGNSQSPFHTSDHLKSIGSKQSRSSVDDEHLEYHMNSYNSATSHSPILTRLAAHDEHNLEHINSQRTNMHRTNSDNRQLTQSQQHLSTSSQQQLVAIGTDGKSHDHHDYHNIKPTKATASTAAAAAPHAHMDTLSTLSNNGQVNIDGSTQAYYVTAAPTHGDDTPFADPADRSDGGGGGSDIVHLAHLPAKYAQTVYLDRSTEYNTQGESHHHHHHRRPRLNNGGDIDTSYVGIYNRRGDQYGDPDGAHGDGRNTHSDADDDDNDNDNDRDGEIESEDILRSSDHLLSTTAYRHHRRRGRSNHRHPDDHGPPHFSSTLSVFTTTPSTALLTTRHHRRIGQEQPISEKDSNLNTTNIVGHYDGFGVLEQFDVTSLPSSHHLPIYTLPEQRHGGHDPYLTDRGAAPVGGGGLGKYRYRYSYDDDYPLSAHQRTAYTSYREQKSYYDEKHENAMRLSNISTTDTSSITTNELFLSPRGVDINPSYTQSTVHENQLHSSSSSKLLVDVDGTTVSHDQHQQQQQQQYISRQSKDNVQSNYLNHSLEMTKNTSGKLRQSQGSSQQQQQQQQNARNHMNEASTKDKVTAASYASKYSSSMSFTTSTHLSQHKIAPQQPSQPPEPLSLQLQYQHQHQQMVAGAEKRQTQTIARSLHQQQYPSHGQFPNQHLFDRNHLISKSGMYPVFQGGEKSQHQHPHLQQQQQQQNLHDPTDRKKRQPPYLRLSSEQSSSMSSTGTNDYDRHILPSSTGGDTINTLPMSLRASQQSEQSIHAVASTTTGSIRRDQQMQHHYHQQQQQHQQKREMDDSFVETTSVGSSVKLTSLTSHRVSGNYYPRQSTITSDATLPGIVNPLQAQNALGRARGHSLSSSSTIHAHTQGGGSMTPTPATMLPKTLVPRPKRGTSLVRPSKMTPNVSAHPSGRQSLSIHYSQSQATSHHGTPLEDDTVAYLASQQQQHDMRGPSFTGKPIGRSGDDSVIKPKRSHLHTATPSSGHRSLSRTSQQPPQPLSPRPMSSAPVLGHGYLPAYDNHLHSADVRPASSFIGFHPHPEFINHIAAPHNPVNLSVEQGHEQKMSRTSDHFTMQSSNQTTVYPPLPYANPHHQYQAPHQQQPPHRYESSILQSTIPKGKDLHHPPFTPSSSPVLSGTSSPISSSTRGSSRGTALIAPLRPLPPAHSQVIEVLPNTPSHSPYAGPNVPSDSSVTSPYLPPVPSADSYARRLSYTSRHSNMGGSFLSSHQPGGGRTSAVHSASISASQHYSSQISRHAIHVSPSIRAGQPPQTATIGSPLLTLKREDSPIPLSSTSSMSSLNMTAVGHHDIAAYTHIDLSTTSSSSSSSLSSTLVTSLAGFTGSNISTGSRQNPRLSSNIGPAVVQPQQGVPPQATLRTSNRSIGRQVLPPPGVRSRQGSFSLIDRTGNPSTTNPPVRGKPPSYPSMGTNTGEQQQQRVYEGGVGQQVLSEHHLSDLEKPDDDDDDDDHRFMQYDELPLQPHEIFQIPPTVLAFITENDDVLSRSDFSIIKKRHLTHRPSLFTSIRNCAKYLHATRLTSSSSVALTITPYHLQSIPYHSVFPYIMKHQLILDNHQYFVQDLARTHSNNMGQVSRDSIAESVSKDLTITAYDTNITASSRVSSPLSSAGQPPLEFSLAPSHQHSTTDEEQYPNHINRPLETHTISPKNNITNGTSSSSTQTMHINQYESFLTWRIPSSVSFCFCPNWFHGYTKSVCRVLSIYNVLRALHKEVFTRFIPSLVPSHSLSKYSQCRPPRSQRGQDDTSSTQGYPPISNTNSNPSKLQIIRSGSSETRKTTSSTASSPKGISSNTPPHQPNRHQPQPIHLPTILTSYLEDITQSIPVLLITNSFNDVDPSYLQMENHPSFSIAHIRGSHCIYIDTPHPVADVISKLLIQLSE